MLGLIWSSLYAFAGTGTYGIIVKEAIEECEVIDGESFLMLLLPADSHDQRRAEGQKNRLLSLSSAPQLPSPSSVTAGMEFVIHALLCRVAHCAVFSVKIPHR